MSDIVHFMLVSDRDIKTMRVAKEITRLVIDPSRNFWLGSLDDKRYFTSEPKGLYDPSSKPWFVILVGWADEDGAERYEKIATNGAEWTYVKQSLGGVRIPFTDEVKRRVNKRIEKFWRKV